MAARHSARWACSRGLSAMCRRLGSHVPSRRRVVGWPACASLPIRQAKASLAAMLTACARCFLTEGTRKHGCGTRSRSRVQLRTPPRPMDEAKAGPLRTHNLTLTRTCPTSTNHSLSLSPRPVASPCVLCSALDIALLASHVPSPLHYTSPLVISC